MEDKIPEGRLKKAEDDFTKLGKVLEDEIFEQAKIIEEQQKKNSCVKWIFLSFLPPSGLYDKFDLDGRRLACGPPCSIGSAIPFLQFDPFCGFLDFGWYCIR